MRVIYKLYINPKVISKNFENFNEIRELITNQTSNL